MTTGEEAEAPVAEQPLLQKSLRWRRSLKKPRQPKPKTVAHPPYFQMIKEAILALNEKSGSSPYAIAKYMEGKHKAVLPANFKKILGHQLKNSAARGKLIRSGHLSSCQRRKEGEEHCRESLQWKECTKSIKSPSVKRAKKVTATA
ncbi:HISTONE H1-3 family protein [Salix suchowensis]|nr:HISTONE H1-3 family protein [Salix suchowensis]